MAGLSLQCGDCGALLKSVEEAQEHAELTSHTNFSESTEAVLNLVCTTCGKPCRSKTETDLHTKRTGHGDFADKTLEMAKPIDLEAPKAPSAVESTAAAESSQQSQEMVVPDVDKSLLEQLESMGFPPARATRALHYSGNSSIEAAINWVAEHEDDPDIDQMPMVPVNDKKESSKPALTPEEVKLKAQELRERARKKKEEEKKMEREREKERIRIGKELLEAKRIEEDNERKRIMALRKAEKEEEKRAREKIRQRLEEDKAERRQKLGLPLEELTAPKPASPVAEKKSALMAGSAASPSLMAALLRLSSLLLLSFHRPIAVIARSDGRDEANIEEFTEELLLRPLPDRKLLAHFHFESAAPPSISNGRHHHLFPKAIAQLVRKFHIRELELSFTQGRWNYERWGGSDPMSSSNAKPPGVELWALFDLHINEIDTTWKNLTHALSGLFCSSINFLESSTAYSSPDWGFLSNSSNLRYGALPREAVCTENLTPWLKLLPCRDKAGLASLLDRPSIYRGYYHSQRLRLVSTELNGIVLKQSLTVVLQPSVQRSSLDSSGEGFLQPSWSISSVFRKKVTGQCVLAKASRIFIEVERGLAAELEKLGSGDFSYNMFFELSSMPDRVIKESNTLQGQSTSTLYEYTVANYNEYKPMNVGIRWKLPLTWSGSQAPFHANRFLMGSGNERGSVAISLKSSQSYAQHLDQSSECTVQVIVFQVVPWYVKVYYHTLQIFVDGKPQIVSDVIEKIRVSPSEDKVSPGTLEMMLRFPCNIQSAALVLDFDKGFLHIDEYPPDANQGFDIPSALISFPDFYSSRNYLIDDSLNPSPLLLEFQENNHVQSYTEVLLVPLTTPDFSMPYNVITFTCTVLALYFGSLLNVLRRRVGEEERLLKCQAEKRGLIPLLLSKLLFKIEGQTQEQSQTPSSSSSSSSIQRHKLVLKVILVAVAAVVWHYLLNDSS